jgi:hypothetical protein
MKTTTVSRKGINQRGRGRPRKWESIIDEIISLSEEDEDLAVCINRGGLKLTSIRTSLYIAASKKGVRVHVSIDNKEGLVFAWLCTDKEKI